MGNRARRERRIHRALRACGLLAGLCWPVLGHASHEQLALADESMMFNEVPSVFSVSRYEERVPDAPASTTVITRDMIRQHGYRSLAEVLGGVRGFSSSNDGSYSYIGVRGILRPGDYNSRVLLMVDGHRLNDAVYDGGLVGSEGPVDMDVIERIEITRGPGSSVYGANAMLAVVNILTRKAQAIGGVESAIGHDSKGLRRARVIAGSKLGGVDAMLAVSSASRAGQSRMNFQNSAQYAPPDNWRAQRLDSERYQRALLNLSYRDIVFSAGHSERSKVIPTAPYDSEYGVSGTDILDQRDWASLGSHLALDGSNELRARVAFDRYHYHGNYVYGDGATGLSYTARDDAWAQWLTGELSWLHKSERHTLLLGVDVVDRPRIQQRYEGTSLVLDDARRSEALGLYVQDSWRLSQALQLVFGGRYDWHKSSSTYAAASPRLAAVWRVDEANVVKMLYGTAYRPPNAFEAHYNDGGDSQKPSPNLSPERVRSAELSWDRSLGERASFAASAYLIRYRNVIDQVLDTDGLLVYRNVAEVRSRGAEAEWRYHSEGGLFAQLGASVLKTQQQPADLPMSAPERQIFAKLVWPLPVAELNLGLEWRRGSHRENARRERVAPADLVSLVLSSSEIGRDWRWRAAIYNLTGARYGDPSGREVRPMSVPQEGRVFALQIEYAM